jgi:membrane protease YdiL (CAAX protease family)
VPALLFPKAIHYQANSFIKITSKTAWFNFVGAILLILLVAPFITWLSEINQQLSLPPAIENMFRPAEEYAKQLQQLLMKVDTGSDIAYTLIVIAFIPAVVEEFFFRGCLQNFVRICFYNSHISVIFSALIFSGFHNQLYSFVPIFVMGLVLGYLYLFSGSIWVPILGHFSFNALSFLFTHLANKYPDNKLLSEDYAFPWWVVLMSLLLSVALLYWMDKKRFKTFHA